LIAELEKDGVFPGPIVTEVAPLTQFYPAEAYHQEYYRSNPDQPYCSFIIDPKVAKFREKFAARLKPAGGG
jgi:peptide-methionine (S)-S-oxide reductase